MQFTKIGTKCRALSQLIVQESGLDPCLFNILIIDLKPTGTTNHIVKYADDTSLLIPQNHNVTLEDEFENIKQWIKTNKLTTNLFKTKELVFHHPNPRGFIPPPPLNNIERVKFAKLLGVFVIEMLGAANKQNPFCNYVTSAFIS